MHECAPRGTAAEALRNPTRVTPLRVRQRRGRFVRSDARRVVRTANRFNLFVMHTQGAFCKHPFSRSPRVRTSWTNPTHERVFSRAQRFPPGGLAAQQAAQVAPKVLAGTLATDGRAPILSNPSGPTSKVRRSARRLGLGFIPSGKRRCRPVAPHLPRFLRTNRHMTP